LTRFSGSDRGEQADCTIVANAGERFGSGCPHAQRLITGCECKNLWGSGSVADLRERLQSADLKQFVACLSKPEKGLNSSFALQFT
jgi:hypothetical protein